MRVKLISRGLLDTGLWTDQNSSSSTFDLMLMPSLFVNIAQTGTTVITQRQFIRNMSLRNHEKIVLITGLVYAAIGRKYSDTTTDVLRGELGIHWRGNSSLKVTTFPSHLSHHI